MSEKQHQVEVVGTEHTSLGVRAECTCGWASWVWVGRGGLRKATTAKWKHVDEINGARP